MESNKAVALLNKGNKDIIDQCFYPLVNRIANFISPAISPNQLSFLGFTFGMMGAISLLIIPGNWSPIICSVFLFLWWILDALDGIHARRTGQSSPFGGFLDHFLDTILIVFLLFAIAIRFEMLTPFFLLLILFRLGAQSLFFLEQSFTHVLNIPTIGPSAETFVLIGTLIAYSFFSVDFMLFTHIPLLAKYAQIIGIDKLNFVKIGALGYLIFLPPATKYLYLRVKQHTSA